MRWKISCFCPRPTRGTYFALTLYTKYDRSEHTSLETHDSVNPAEWLLQPVYDIIFFNDTLSAEKNKRHVPFCWCKNWCCPFWPRTAGGRQKTSKWTDRKPEADEKRVENERVQHGLTTSVYYTRVHGGRTTDAKVYVARTVL